MRISKKVSSSLAERYFFRNSHVPQNLRITRNDFLLASFQLHDSPHLCCCYVFGERNVALHFWKARHSEGEFWANETALGFVSSVVSWVTRKRILNPKRALPCDRSSSDRRSDFSRRNSRSVRDANGYPLSTELR